LFVTHKLDNHHDANLKHGNKRAFFIKDNQTETWLINETCDVSATMTHVVVVVDILQFPYPFLSDLLFSALLCPSFLEYL